MPAQPGQVRGGTAATGQPGQVGAVFAIRGQIAGLDVFDSPRTWASLMPKLVRSYGLDALEAAVRWPCGSTPCGLRHSEVEITVELLDNRNVVLVAKSRGVARIN